MVPYFDDPGLSLRPTVYSESFPNSNDDLPFTNHERAVRDSRYKLIRRTGETDEFYDLASDPWEATDLFPGLTPGSREETAYLGLVAEFVALGVD